MTTVTPYPHLTIDEQGTATIGRTRYKVRLLAAEHFHYGWSAEEILRQHPDLRPEEVYSALTYAYDHSEEILRAIEQTAEQANSLSAAQRLSRSELLKRRSSKSEG